MGEALFCSGRYKKSFIPPQRGEEEVGDLALLSTISPLKSRFPDTREGLLVRGSDALVVPGSPGAMLNSPHVQREVILGRTTLCHQALQQCHPTLHSTLSVSPNTQRCPIAYLVPGETEKIKEGRKPPYKKR
ncbi:hypothetical protein ILYODFUR_017203 [Ilyodon furcidens]|uniref:Uncharacterized protein n=1 Tax=Ilyodon furcidens TaxID=33524 RepID=A0ABV0TB42_9TELE